MNTDEVVQAVSSGAVIVDARVPRLYAAGHIDGSLNIQLNDSFGIYVGWLVEFDKPLVLILPTDRADAAEEATTQLLRIGWDNVVGHLAGGFDAWVEAGQSVASNEVFTVDDLYREYVGQESPVILDVHQHDEWDVGHIPRSTHFHLGHFSGELSELPRDREVWTICAGGDRSAIAASLLLKAGWKVRAVTPGGVPDWAASGYPIELDSE